MRQTLSIETTTHGRILVEDAADVVSPRLLIAFHGYGQSARAMLDDVLRIPGIGAWCVASVQGLHRFYTRDDQSVVASWMTREDRELAIADNLAYVDKAVEILESQGQRPPVGASGPGPGTQAKLVFLGFSQGVAMAYRAAMSGSHPAAGVIALAGDIPPELKVRSTPSEGHARPWPRILIGAGWHDKFYGTDKVQADVSFLSAHGIAHEVVRFQGGHEWSEDFREAAGAFLKEL